MKYMYDTMTSNQFLKLKAFSRAVSLAILIISLSPSAFSKSSTEEEETKLEKEETKFQNKTSEFQISFSDKKLRKKIDEFLAEEKFSITNLTLFLKDKGIRSLEDLIKNISKSDESDSSESSIHYSLEDLLNLIKEFSIEQVLFLADILCENFLKLEGSKKVKVNNNEDDLRKYSNILKLTQNFLKLIKPDASQNITAPLFVFVRLRKENLKLPPDIIDYLGQSEPDEEYKEYFITSINKIFKNEKSDDEKVSFLERFKEPSIYQKTRKLFNSIFDKLYEQYLNIKVPEDKKEIFFKNIEQRLNLLPKSPHGEKLLKEHSLQLDPLVISYATQYFSPGVFSWDEEKFEETEWDYLNDYKAGATFLTLYYPGNVTVHKPESSSSIIKIDSPPFHKDYPLEEIPKEIFPGYNMFIPWDKEKNKPVSSLKGIVISVYGGMLPPFQPKLRDNEQFFLNEGYIFITLNLTDVNEKGKVLNNKTIPDHQLYMNKDFLDSLLYQINLFVKALKGDKYSFKQGLLSFKKATDKKNEATDKEDREESPSSSSSSSSSSSEGENAPKKAVNELPLSPEVEDKLQQINKVIKNLPIYLMGHSFGGLVALNYTENQYYTDAPKINGVIVQDGAVSEKAMINKKFLHKEIDPSHPEKVKNIEVPVLLLHNLDDRNVSATGMVDFFQLLTKDKIDAYLHFTRQSHGTSLYGPIQKGHGISPYKKSSQKFRKSILNFMLINRSKEKNKAAREEAHLDSDWQVLRYKYVAARNIRGELSTPDLLEERTLGELFKIYKNSGHDKNENSNILEKEWNGLYRPSLMALYTIPKVFPSLEDSENIRKKLKELINQPQVVKHMANYLLPFYRRYIMEEFSYKLSESGEEKLKESVATAIPKLIKNAINEYDNREIADLSVQLMRQMNLQGWIEILFLSNPNLSQKINDDEEFKKFELSIKEKFKNFIAELLAAKHKRQQRKEVTLKEFFHSQEGEESY